jgi:imidazolonepropionase-like amidohydrolase
VKFLLAATLLLSALPACGQQSSLVLQNFRLIDGTGKPPIDHASLLIENGKISRVLLRGASAPHTPGAQILKLDGKTVMPALINGHGHLGLTQGTSVAAQNFTAENVEHQLAQYERYGVTTVMSLGMNKDLLYSMRSAQEKGELGGATILSADHGVGVPNGMPPAAMTENGRVYRPSGEEEARKDVREMAARDPNLVKIWVDDSLHKLPAPDPKVYAAVIDEAHKLHLRVAAHVYYLGDSKRLLGDGVDILAHSVRDQDIDADAVSEIVRRKVFYIPTLQLEEAFFIYGEQPVWTTSAFFKSALNPALAAQLASSKYQTGVQNDPATQVHKMALRTALHNLQKLNTAHALIGFGTDSGANPYRIAGFAEHRELVLMVEAGMTPLEAIHSATAVAAQMLHIEEKTGTITAGKQADLLVLEADPSSHIENTQKIAMVFHNGKRVEH